MRMCAEGGEMREGCHLTPRLGLSDDTKGRSPPKLDRSLSEVISRLHSSCHNEGTLSLA